MLKPRILVVGAGAVGGYFGGRLAAAGRDVTFLVRPERARVLRDRGLLIESPLGDAAVTPQLVLAADIQDAYDIVFLSLKAYALEAGLDDFAPAIGPGSVILPVLNGLQHMDLLARRFGAAHLIGGVCRIAAQLQDGRIRQLSALQQIAYGELNGDRTPRIAQVDAVMQGVGFDAVVSDHIVQDMWEKWIQLAGLGAITCLFGGPVGRVASVQGGPEIASALWGECAEVARQCGHAPSPAFATSVLSQLTDPGSSLTSSMYRDTKAGAPVEVESILGDLVTRARSAGVATPLLQAAAVALRIYAAGLAAQR